MRERDVTYVDVMFIIRGHENTRTGGSERVMLDTRSLGEKTALERDAVKREGARGKSELTMKDTEVDSVGGKIKSKPSMGP